MYLMLVTWIPRNPWIPPKNVGQIPWWFVGESCQEFLWESRSVLPKGAGIWMGSQEEHLGRIVPVLRDFTMPQEGKSTLTFVGKNYRFGRWLSSLQIRGLWFLLPFWILLDIAPLKTKMEPESESLEKEISIGNYPLQVLCNYYAREYRFSWCFTELDFWETHTRNTLFQDVWGTKSHQHLDLWARLSNSGCLVIFPTYH